MLCLAKWMSLMENERMASTRIPICPNVSQLVERGHVLKTDRFHKLGSRVNSSPVIDDEFLNHAGPSDDELAQIEKEIEGATA